MLLPPFRGADLKAYDAQGEDITAELFAPSGLMKVDADYSGKPFEEWLPSDWPRTYQNPTYDNVYAVGIAFAPPHAIPEPRTSSNGTPISPTPPRTGQPSAMIGKVILLNKKCKTDNVNLKLSNISPNVMEVFKIMRLNKVLSIYGDEAKAIAAFDKKGWFG